MRSVLLALSLFATAAFTFCQEKNWDPKTAFGAVQVVVELTKVQFTKSQLDKLMAKAKLIEKARSDAAGREKALYQREQAKAIEIAGRLLGGAKPTALQQKRIEDMRGQLTRITDDLASQIEEIVNGSVAILTKTQIDALVYDAAAHKEALDFIKRTRSVPDAEWEDYKMKASIELMRGQFKGVMRTVKDGTNPNAPNTKEIWRNQVDLLRGMMENAQKTGLEKLNYYRGMPQNEVDKAADDLMRSWVTEYGELEATQEYLRNVLTPEGAVAAIAAFSARAK